MIPVVLLTCALLSSASAHFYKSVQGHYGEYSVVKGYFKQDDDDTNSTTFSHFDNLGLKSNISWDQFKEEIEELNANAPLNTTYKVIYYARHAEGYHNAAEDYFGDDAWNCYYNYLNGNGTVEWGPDAYLTEKGINTAKNNSNLIRSLLSSGFPLPQSFYLSPFTRCGDTLELTWGDIVLDTGYVTPIFKESIREVLDAETCDKRRSRAYLAARYPKYDFEANFVEEDILWKPDLMETDGMLYWRARQFLDDVFNSDENTFISVTSHSVIGAGFLRAIGHRVFPLTTGAIIPTIVKRVSSLDFNPVDILAKSNVTVGTSSTTTTCGTSISLSTIPSSIATSEMSVYNASIYTVTTIYADSTLNGTSTSVSPSSSSS